MKALLAEMAARAALAALGLGLRAVAVALEARGRWRERSSYQRHMDEDARWRGAQAAEGRRF